MELTEQIRAQKNVELRKRVYRTIQSMYGLFRGSPRNIQITDRYLNIWEPKSNTIKDVVDFPYESKKGSLAEKKNANHCLFAMVTTLIQVWHTHCRTDDDSCIEALEAWLDKIEHVIVAWSALQIRGCDETGYYFKLPRGE